MIKKYKYELRFRPQVRTKSLDKKNDGTRREIQKNWPGKVPDRDTWLVRIAVSNSER